MLKSIRALLLCSTLSLCAITPAHAQDASDPAATPAPGPDQAEEAGAPEFNVIMVSARRRQESERTVPVTITVLTPEDLQRTEVYDQFSLMAQVPAFQNYTRSPGNGAITGQNRIRGIPGVAYYFNEAPLTPTQGTFYAQYFDIASIQALKGAQGTLFGQANNAGALLFEPNTPGDELGGYVMAEVGTFDKANFEAAVDIPIGGDGDAAVRIAGKSFYRDGFLRDIYSDARQNIENYKVLRGILEVGRNGDVTNSTMVQVQHVKDFGEPPRYIEAFNTANPAVVGWAAINGFATVADFLAAVDYTLALQRDIGVHRFAGWSTGCPARNGQSFTLNVVPGPNFLASQSSPCPPGRNRTTDYSIVNKTTIALSDDWQLKNIASYYTADPVASTFNVDATRLILFEANSRNSLNRTEGDTITEELQLSGSMMGDRLNFIGGVFYSVDRSLSPNAFSAIVNTFNYTVTRTKRTTDSKAVYGQADFDIIPELSVTAGLRYTWDTTEQRITRLDPLTFREIAILADGKGDPRGYAEWKTLDYNFSLNYQLTPRTMVYATHSRGHTAGGLQFLPGFERFEPDVLSSYEVGIKSDFSVGPADFRLDAAAYYGDYADVQVSTGIVDPVNNTVLIGRFNAAQAEIKGFEVELSGRLGDFLTVRSYVNYSDAKYTEYPSVDPVTRLPVDLSGTPFPSNPPWKFGIAPTVYLPFDPDTVGEISFGANYTWQDQVWASVSRPPASAANPLDGGSICRLQRTAQNGFGPLSADGSFAWIDCSPARDNLDLSLIWDDVLGNSGLQIGGRVTNVFDSDTPTGNGGLWATLGFSVLDAPYPRMASIWVRKTF